MLRSINVDNPVDFIFLTRSKTYRTFSFDTDDESLTADNMNINNDGTLVKADPHLTVRGCSCKSLRGGGWMGTGAEVRSSDIGGLNGNLTKQHFQEATSVSTLLLTG